LVVVVSAAAVQAVVGNLLSRFSIFIDYPTF